jgi:Cu/Zn superoxide dismutase
MKPYSPQTTKKKKRSTVSVPTAVAVFHTPKVEGEVVARPCRKGKGKGKGIDLLVHFRRFPPGQHGFHIHKAGDMRQKDCSGLCEHYDKGHHRHGSYQSRERHTGDLGNLTRSRRKRRYCLPNVSVQELWGRSIIVHEGPDDVGKGGYEDSHTTGHSGSRMACAIFGRGQER